jgi:hypothetical protein
MEEFKLVVLITALALIIAEVLLRTIDFASVYIKKVGRTLQKKLK